MKFKFLLCPATMLFAAWLVLTARAQFGYVSNDQGVTITNYTGSGGAVVIPPTIDNKPVVMIGNYAFARRISIISVVIPDSVTNIGDGAFTYLDTHSRLTELKLGRNVAQIGKHAFSGCDQLTNIVIPESVTSIGGQAFLFCNKLTVIAIPAKTTHIAAGAFNACFQLKSINADSNNPAYCSVDGVLYDKARTQLLQFPSGKGGGYIIPDGVTNIADFALWNCPYLTSLTLPEGITSIHSEEFAACSKLITLTIPASVTHIGPNAFNSCSELKAIYFRGNAPDYTGSDRGAPVGALDTGTIYYAPKTTGWGATYGGRPTAQWK